MSDTVSPARDTSPGGSLNPEIYQARRQRLRRAMGPHLRVSEPVLRFDLGDHIARRHGVQVTEVACGKTCVVTTLSTSTPAAVQCPDCLDAMAKTA